REGFTELFASASARLRLGVSTTRILLDYSSVPGELILKPVLEETLSLGQFRLKGRASVELRAPGITVIDPDTIVITLAAEWRIWDSAE
ncbi:MAG: hypothetical protein PQJ50_14910, partial [Spirochaetales bacterium]|nr:hypothetical protein [Spirochaetales bacterium]